MDLKSEKKIADNQPIKITCSCGTTTVYPYMIVKMFMLIRNLMEAFGFNITIGLNIEQLCNAICIIADKDLSAVMMDDNLRYLLCDDERVVTDSEKNMFESVIDACLFGIRKIDYDRFIYISSLNKDNKFNESIYNDMNIIFNKLTNQQLLDKFVVWMSSYYDDYFLVFVNNNKTILVEEDNDEYAAYVIDNEDFTVDGLHFVLNIGENVEQKYTSCLEVSGENIDKSYKHGIMTINNNGVCRYSLTVYYAAIVYNIIMDSPKKSISFKMIYLEEYDDDELKYDFLPRNSNLTRENSRTSLIENDQKLIKIIEPYPDKYISSIGQDLLEICEELYGGNDDKKDSGNKETG
jgi:hypothetical protein